MKPTDSAREDFHWTQAWPDALAFASGLTMAWFLEWETTDLVWSLWLSSFVVGYATIVWSATRGLREFSTNMAADRTPGRRPGKLLAGISLLLGSLVLIAFFTVHFGGFHYGHSIFLNALFPLTGEGISAAGFPGAELYQEVVRRYWVFLPVAFAAERKGFARKGAIQSTRSSSAKELPAHATSPVTGDGRELAAPYINVVRMHLLIFFFAAAHFANIDSFLVYATVYAVYFFPWRVLRATARRRQALSGN